MDNSYEQLASKHARHVNSHMVELLNQGYGRNFVRAKGTSAFDNTGKRYLDLVAAYGTNSIGHNHPKVTAAAKKCIEEDNYNFLHIGLNGVEGELAELLCEILGQPFQYAMFSNSGSEAIEVAMKLAAGVTGRSRFAFARGGFHGVGIGSLSLMGQPRYRQPYENLLMQNHRIDFGDLTGLESILADKNIAAFVVEPVQSEAGVILPPPGYLSKAQELCRNYGSLLIADEIQTGLGRTGSILCSASEEVVPDVVVLAKALSGGLMPIGATITSRDLFCKAFGKSDTWDLFGSTFSGNALACRVAAACLGVIQSEKLVENSRAVGEYLLKSLNESVGRHPLVKDIRGQGLLVGIELDQSGAGPGHNVGELGRDFPSFGQIISYLLLQEGVLIQPALHDPNVLKAVPPLCITKDEVDFFVENLRNVLLTYH